MQSTALLASGLELSDILKLEHESGSSLDICKDASRLLALVNQTLSYVLRDTGIKSPIVSTSRALHDWLRFDMGTLRRERLRVLYLDSAKRLLSDQILAEGSINSVSVDVREILREALLCDATDMILVHNHPSNCNLPSPADVTLTKRISEVAELCDIRLLDHLIVSRSGVRSMQVDGYFNMEPAR